MKYIDTEKLKALLSDLREEHKNYKGDFHEGVVFAVDELEDDIIDSLLQEQPEVDLEKEIEEHAIFMPHGEFASDNEIQEDMEWAKKEFHHFYEMGINARK